MIEEAIKALRQGKPVLIYDFDTREGETDLVYPAKHVTSKSVLKMRKDAGGLICVSIHPVAAKKLGLPFMTEIFDELSTKIPAFKKLVMSKPKYDVKTSFSLWVNHKGTYTGVTDKDRALTIRKIGEIVEKALNGGSVNFFEEFMSPGHVPILRAADNLLAERVGHTELSIALAEMAGITPAMALCEMLDGETGEALSKNDAKSYGKENGIPFIKGVDIIKAYRKYLKYKIKNKKL